MVFLLDYPDFYRIVFPAFFRALGKLLLRFPENFFPDSFWEILTLILHGVIGILFLRFFVRLPTLLEICVGIFLGIGLTTFVLEIPAIGLWLNSYTVWLTLTGMIMILAFLRYRLGWSACRPNFSSEPLLETWQKGFYWTAFIFLALMTVLSFYHALFYPVHYWDALIYYVHYGKMTYQQGGFPIQVCLQVGLGLGANYPHLYPLHQAVTALLAGHWSDLYGQFLCPAAGLAAVIGLYYTALYLFKNRLIAILSVLSFRTIPLVTSYIIWESDYSLVLAYTALYLLFLAWFLEAKTWRSYQPLLLVSAIFPHINYLGWIVWPGTIWALWIMRANLLIRNPFHLLGLGSILLWLGWGLTWYVRNWMVTGNPVYAFFPTIFGGKNINLEVLRSCEQEWLYHGNGVAGLGNTLWERLIRSPRFIIHDWRVAPILGGIMFPALLLGWKRKQPFFLISGGLVILYLFYEYVVSGFYLYHILAVFPLLGIFVGRFLSAIQEPRKMLGLSGLILAAGIIPGLSVSLMGSKYPYPQLPLFAHPGIEKESFYRLVFPHEYPAWDYLNHQAKPHAGILTHDNRYHVFRDDLQIIHLDDCNLVPRYGKPYPEIHAYLLSRGIRYYLEIPDEKTHPITQRLGHRSYLKDPKFFKSILQSGEVHLYQLVE